jgi:hypothetical protein
MKVSDMIRNLQHFIDMHGDLECWYAEDDDGNGYHPVNFNPTMMCVDNYNNVYSWRDVEDEDLDEVVLLKKICIVN